MKFTEVIYWAILYPLFKRFKRNIRCWISHNWIETERPNIEKCTKCGEKQVIINAIFEDE